ncbi:MAG: ATP synthase F0 subunit B [Candidatus Schekmanbacteria bacterium]|nr:ATP synthase F0 subunit B [Candidatus Schekmanbacteria bacterium]
MSSLSGRRNLAAVIAFAVFLCFSFSIAYAAEEGEHAGIDISKEVFKWINFLILAGALFFILKKTVKEFFEMRIENIKKSLDESRKAEEEASVKLKDAERKLSALSSEIEQIKRNTAKLIEDEKNRIIKESGDKAQRIIAQNEKNIRYEYENSLKELKSEMVKNAAKMAEAILTEKVSTEERKRVFNKYLSMLGGIN